MDDFKHLKKTNAAIEKAELRKNRIKNLKQIHSQGDAHIQFA